MAPKNYRVAPQERLWIRTCFWRPFKSLLASILGGGQASMFDDFWMIFGTSWLTLAMFSAALSCLGFRCSWLGLQPTLPRKSKNLPRTKPRIQEPAEDKAEKKIRTNAFRKTQISKLSSSKLPSLSQPSLLQKLWAAVLPPRGASIRRPSRVGVLDRTHGFCQSFLPSSFRILLLGGSCLPPPKSSPSSLGPTPSAAAICGAGASWRLLGRKNRVPRGLQKLIKF